MYVGTVSTAMSVSAAMFVSARNPIYIKWLACINVCQSCNPHGNKSNIDSITDLLKDSSYHITTMVVDHFKNGHVGTTAKHGCGHCCRCLLLIHHHSSCSTADNYHGPGLMVHSKALPGADEGTQYGLVVFYGAPPADRRYGQGN